MRSDETLAALHRLRAMGVASPSTISAPAILPSRYQAFPFDKIKIDRSFVQNPAG